MKNVVHSSFVLEKLGRKLHFLHVTNVLFVFQIIYLINYLRVPYKFCKEYATIARDHLLSWSDRIRISSYLKAIPDRFGHADFLALDKAFQHYGDGNVYILITDNLA